MGKILEVTNALLDSANTAANVTNDYLTKQANYATQIKQIQLRDDVNALMDEIRRDGNSDNWQNTVNTFFEKLKIGMSDKKSAYYCQNIRQANMFTPVLESARAGVSEKLVQMKFTADRDKAIVNYNNSLIKLKNQVQGQDFISQANALAKGLKEGGYINDQELQSLMDSNYETAWKTGVIKFFENSIDDAIKNGESKEALFEHALKQSENLMGTDIAGMPKTFDKEVWTEQARKVAYSNYTAKQQDIWNESEKKCAQIFDTVMDGTTAEERNQARLMGRAFLDTIKYTGRISPEQLTKWTNYFKLEDPSTTKSGASSAFKKLTPKEQMDFYLREAEKGSKGAEGGINSFYNAREMFKNSMLDEVRAVNPDAKWVDVEKAYPECMGFFEEAKKRMRNIPGMSEVINTAENMLGTILNTKDDKKKYEEEAGRAMDIVFDMLAEVDVSNMDKAAVEDYKKRVARMMNSLYGGVLEKQKNYKWLKDDVSNPEVLRNYKEGVFGNEATMARALQERNANPDLVYKDSNQTIIENYGEDLKAGLTSLEAAEKDQIADYLKYNAGLNINKKDIKGDYEADGVYDVNPNKIYTVVARDEHGRPVDEYQYKFSSSDGKHVTMQRKKKGETKWETVRTAKQQAVYDSPEDTAKRAVQETNWKNAEIPSGGFTYRDENNQLKQITYTDADGEERPITQTYWKHLSTIEKKRIIQDYIQKNPDAAKEWISGLPSK